MYSLWGVWAAAALLWPDRISGPLDGIPLDRVAEAVLIAGVLPALWYLHPGFLRTTRAVAAGILATLAFYMRLNNLIMAAGIALLALPLDVTVRALIQPRGWWHRIAWRTAVIVPATIALGMAFLAWRNWHDSGVFDTFYGT